MPCKALCSILLSVGGWSKLLPMGHLAELVKAKRYDLRLSQKAFGDRLRLQNGSSYVSRIEKGLIVPSRTRLLQMEQEFSFFPGELEAAALSDEQARVKAS